MNSFSRYYRLFIMLFLANVICFIFVYECNRSCWEFDCIIVRVKHKYFYFSLFFLFTSLFYCGSLKLLELFVEAKKRITTRWIILIVLNAIFVLLLYSINYMYYISSSQRFVMYNDIMHTLLRILFKYVLEVSYEYPLISFLVVINYIWVTWMVLRYRNEISRSQ